MARAGLGWTLDDLAKASGVNRRSIMTFERNGPVLPATVEKLRAALAAHGVEFINGGKRTGVAIQRKD